MSCSVFVTIDRGPTEALVDALATGGVLLTDVGGGADAQLYHGDLPTDPDTVDEWFVAGLPWTDETATLVAYSRDVVITTVVIDGQAVSSTRSDAEATTLDDWLEEAA